MTLHYYRLIMDSMKLFMLNIFMYLLLLEAYLFLYLLQQRYGVELPFITLFLGGVFTFFAVTVWFNAAQVWHAALKTGHRVLMRAIISELPIALLLLIIFMIRLDMGPQSMSWDSQTLFILFTGYLFLFPLVMSMTKSHIKKLA